MSFTGTLDKCKACDKTVYFIDLLTVDGIVYHKTCFKCDHCKGTLQMSNYSSMEGVLYCKTHFEQLFKESGNFSKNFHSGQWEKSSEPKAPNRLSSIFCGTQDKCAACTKTVYPLEKITLEGEAYHKTCFKCATGGCHLTPSSYAALDGILYCKHHFGQLFMEKGNYKHVLEAAKLKREHEKEQGHVEAPSEPAPTEDPAPAEEEATEETEPAPTEEETEPAEAEAEAEATPDNE